MTEVFLSVNEIDCKGIKWIDTRFSLQDNTEGRKKFEESHIARAVYWDLEKDLSDMTKQSGRHPMPEKDDLVTLFRNSGLEMDDAIVIYDDGGSPFAARAWWLLKYAGFRNAKIALEGFDALREIGIPIEHENRIPSPTNVVPVWDETIYANRQKVNEIVEGLESGKLVDARSAARYRGEQEPIDPIAGRIPTALNFDWEQLKKDSRFRVDEIVRNELIKIVDPAEAVTVYCGSGVTAAPLYAMLAHIGFANIRLYVGSYSDWISVEGTKIAKG